MCFMTYITNQHAKHLPYAGMAASIPALCVLSHKDPSIFQPPYPLQWLKPTAFAVGQKYSEFNRFKSTISSCSQVVLFLQNAYINTLWLMLVYVCFMLEYSCFMRHYPVGAPARTSLYQQKATILSQYNDKQRQEKILKNRLRTKIHTS